jgi:hypothetical protein
MRLYCNTWTFLGYSSNSTTRFFMGLQAHQLGVTTMKRLDQSFFHPETDMSQLELETGRVFYTRFSQPCMLIAYYSEPLQYFY